ncbi:hypothetical protein AGABI2DRAFT_143559 [Agaricus bisporus var. bisporus H97]|uniref:hypothetical protein n=1 Tax=Agaricus bisporus var. bisporus (strain H97 / ATCC MYA-4626 / FGSC 10389) TaxID=936046 RepID=UPI00029F520B|nr:hypothetical protein AGABI2DRAFT_143559 [Agaricus bisporus var. bisporus H97]EKV46442.1 hypothetical protein AGABI2DRAFT_143559 [Agaricus bisporus var. bisporus H97]
MDKTCKTVSVKRAHNKLTKAAEEIDNDNAAKLLEAIEDFAKRIVPLFEEVELGRTRIQELENDQRHSSEHLTAKSRQVESLQQQCFELHSSNGVLEQKFLDALESAELLQTKTEESQRQLMEVKKGLVMREEEHRQAIDSLKRFKISDERKSEKVRGLKREVIELSQKLRQVREVREEEQDSRMDVDQEHKPTTTAPFGTNTHLPGLSSSNIAVADEGWNVTRNFGFEGMPRPGFGSRRDVDSKKMNRLTKKQPPGGSKASSNFPLNLDAKGRPKAAVHIGPKSTIRVAQRF